MGEPVSTPRASATESARSMWQYGIGSAEPAPWSSSPEAMSRKLQGRGSRSAGLWVRRKRRTTFREHAKEARDAV